jgi:hypothetical protein
MCTEIDASQPNTCTTDDLADVAQAINNARQAVMEALDVSALDTLESVHDDSVQSMQRLLQPLANLEDDDDVLRPIVDQVASALESATGSANTHAEQVTLTSALRTGLWLDDDDKRQCATASGWRHESLNWMHEVAQDSRAPAPACELHAELRCMGGLIDKLIMLLQAIDQDPRYSRSDYTAKFREFLLLSGHLATGEKKRSKWIVCKQCYRPNIHKFFKGELVDGSKDPCGARTFFPVDYTPIVSAICTLSNLKARFHSVGDAALSFGISAAQIAGINRRINTAWIRLCWRLFPACVRQTTAGVVYTITFFKKSCVLYAVDLITQQEQGGHFSSTFAAENGQSVAKQVCRACKTRLSELDYHPCCVEEHTAWSSKHWEARQQLRLRAAGLRKALAQVDENKALLALLPAAESFVWLGPSSGGVSHFKTYADAEAEEMAEALRAGQEQRDEHERQVGGVDADEDGIADDQALEGEGDDDDGDADDDDE